MSFCSPVGPIGHHGLYTQLGILISSFAVLYFLEVGHRHLKVGAKGGKLVLTPNHKAAVFRCDDVGGGFECKVKVALGIFDGEILEECYSATLRNQAFGADAEAWGTEHQNLVFGNIGFTNYECTDEIHSGILRGELHLGDL